MGVAAAFTLTATVVGPGRDRTLGLVSMGRTGRWCFWHIASRFLGEKEP